MAVPGINKLRAVNIVISSLVGHFNFHNLAFACRLWHHNDARCSMIDHEKFQKGRMWAYAAGVLIFVAVVAWKFTAR